MGSRLQHLGGAGCRRIVRDRAAQSTGDDVSAPPTTSLRSAGSAASLPPHCVLAATIIVVGAMTPGYRPWADAVSRLASRDEPRRLLARAGLVSYGVLVVVGAGPLADREPQHRKPLAWLIVGFGRAGVVAGLVPKDPPWTPHTFTSSVHVASTIVGGAMLLAAMALVARFAPAVDVIADLQPSSAA